MITCVALLRAVNVGGHQKVAMSALRASVSDMGFSDVRTLLQSGNLVFRSAAATALGLEQRLEAEAARRLALQTEFFVRSAEEWAALIAANPFLEQARQDPSHLLVMFLKGAPGPVEVAALRAAVTGAEVVHVQGREAYVVYPNGIGRSRLTSALIEKKLGTRGTGRNWNTVVKLAALAGS